MANFTGSAKPDLSQLSKVWFSNSNSTSTGNTTTQTSLIPASYIGTKTIPADFFTPGKSLRIRLSGVYSTVTLTAGVTITVKLGSTTIASVNFGSLANIVNNRTWQGQVIITCYESGQNGKVVCCGGLQFSTALTGQVFADLSNAGSQTTINTTVEQDIDVLGSFSSLLTSQNITTLSAIIEVLN